VARASVEIEVARAAVLVVFMEERYRRPRGRSRSWDRFTRSEAEVSRRRVGGSLQREA
jgi:hypothetical protein